MQIGAGEQIGVLCELFPGMGRIYYFVDGGGGGELPTTR